MLEFIQRGGPLMWPILLCSVISVTIILERSWRFHRSRMRLPNLLPRVKILLREGRAAEAAGLCEKAGDPAAHVLAAGIHTGKRPAEEKEKLMSRAGSKAIRNLEKNINVLAVIGNTSPLLGLLGTVTGMISAFMAIQESGGRADASMLAGGIWEALITTAAGLFVAIPTLAAYYYFEGRVDAMAAAMKDAAEEFLEL